MSLRIGQDLPHNISLMGFPTAKDLETKLVRPNSDGVKIGATDEVRGVVVCIFWIMKAQDFGSTNPPSNWHYKGLYEFCTENLKILW